MKKEADRMSVAARFSASAGTYDQATVIQPQVAEKVFSMINALDSPGRVLEIGCGTGLLTEKLTKHFPTVRIDAVDISEKMISRSMKRFANRTIKWSVADVMDLPESVMYPLIISSSALHWINPVASVLTKLSRLLSRDGHLIFALMVNGTLGELHAARIRVAPHKPPMGLLPSVSEVRHAVQASGLRILEDSEENIRLNYPSASLLLSRIHDQGSTGGNVSASVVPMNRSELRDLVMDYDTRYKCDDGVYATYHIACFKAVKL